MTISGIYSNRVPPLPIPNREVKPISADGTAERWESRSMPTFKRVLIFESELSFFCPKLWESLKKNQKVERFKSQNSTAPFLYNPELRSILATRSTQILISYLSLLIIL